MNTLKTERRDLAEKAKKLRREGFATGNLFGHKIEGSIPVKFVATELEKAMKGHGKGAKLALDLDGQIYQVLVKDIGDYIIQNAPSLLLGSRQTVANALTELNSKKATLG